MKTILGAFALGVLALGAARFAFAPLNPSTHHHANWAIFVDGERLDLSGDRYMEEVSACSASDAGILPTQRIHMHENNQDVVHVHHPGATWGALMANLGLSLGDDHLFTGEGDRYFDGEDGRSIVFVLNGIAVPSVHNRVVASGDRLLVSVTGQRDAALTREFPQVADNAEEFNQRMDPASCAGHGDLPFLTRMRLAFWG
ncbi:MAG: hypothetical protein P8188_08035 [Gemmatimonadota bacterium]